MHLVHVSRWNRSHVRVRVRLVRAASSHNAAESRLTSNGKHIEQNQRPQLLCVLLVHGIYAIDLAHDATVGERSTNSKKFLRVTKIYLWRNQQRGEGECIYIPL